MGAEDRDDRRRRDSRDRRSDRPRDHRRRSVSKDDKDIRDRDRPSRRYHDDGKERRRHHSRSRSPRRRHDKERSSRNDDPSPSPPPKRRRRSYSQSKSPPPRRARGPLPSQQDQFRQGDDAPAAEPVVEKQKPNFNATGLLAKEANTVAGTNTVLKYHEPPEARKPSSKEQWRMFVFKAKDMIDTIHLYSRSCWLMGRDQAIVDFQLEHPSISKQHAVVQFRHITKTDEYGDKSSKVKPYLIDLDSANGTRLNGEKIGGSRYIELRDGDVVAFGDSEREYVMMLPK
jgi:smad nuclear-interacting protein 1